MTENKELFQDLLESFPDDRAVKYLKDLQVIQDSLHMIQENIGLLKESPEEFAEVHQSLVDRFDNLVKNFEHDVAEVGIFHRVVISSATPLSDAMKEKILAEVEKRWGDRYVVDYHVDPAVIGGIRLEVDEAVFDTTFRTRLDQLAREV